jgi:hypothetical protein
MEPGRNAYITSIGKIRRSMKARQMIAAGVVRRGIGCWAIVVSLWPQKKLTVLTIERTGENFVIRL